LKEIDFPDIEIVQHLSIDSVRLTRLLNDILFRFKTLKKHIHGQLLTSIEKCIWNWLGSFPDQFNFMTDRAKNEELTDVCDRFFDQLDVFSENNNKRKSSLWPLQMLLLLLCPKIIEEVVNVDSGAPCSQRHSKKRRFIEDVRRSLSSPHGSSKQMTEAAAVTAIKLCRASTYVNIRDSSNYIFNLVQSVVSDLKALIFNPSKPFARNQATVLQDADLMTDCFVSLFRITPHSADAIKVCFTLKLTKRTFFNGKL
jgi:neurofibromin 1